jgi:hypothetical protein
MRPPAPAGVLEAIAAEVLEFYAPFNVATTRSGAEWRAHLAAGNRGVRVIFVRAATGILDAGKRAGIRAVEAFVR